MANSCLRNILLVSNILCCTLGIAMIAGGIWLLVDEHSLQNIVNSFLSSENETLSVGDDSSSTIQEVKVNSHGNRTAAQLLEEIYSHEYFDYLMIGVGAITLLISLFGFCGAKKESLWLLGTYIFFTILILLLQIGAIVIINLRLEGIQHAKEVIGEAININFGDLEGDGFIQTIFFGALSLGTLLILLVSFCFCHSVRKQKTGQYDGV